MAYDEGMAQRIRERLEEVHGVVEKKMFGGIGWTVHGHMACGVHKGGEMMVRNRADFDALQEEPGCRAMTRGGKPMLGWLLIAPEAIDEEEALDRWIARGLEHARSLPPK